MATKKKKLFDSIRQGASGTLSGHEKEWTAPAAPKRQTQNTGRGTGSQTTNAGRGTTTTSNGLEILQAAQRQLGGTPYTPSTSVPALSVPGLGKTMTPQERVALVRSTEERRKQKEKEAAAALGNDKIGEDMRQELKERKEAEKVTFSDFLADPLYAISAKAAPIGRDIEGAARMIFKPSEYAEREKRRANYNASLEAPQKADTGRALQGVLQQGIDEAGTGLVSTADFILGAPLRAAGWEDNPLHKFNEAAQASKAATQEYYAKNMENASGAAKTAENLGVQAVAAVPDLVLAYFTAGGSTGAGALARGGTRLAGREAALAGAEAVSKRAGTTQLARDVARSSAKNPMFWTSFARTTGNSYEQAKAQGASDWEASMYAIVNGVLNSQVEAGSGVQALPTELQKGGSAALAFLRSAVEEGNEEVVQGVIERSLQNLTYDADNALVSTTDENAIFNPVTAAKEWGSGAAVGGILGLPGAVVQGGRNMRSNQQASAEADARMAEAERQRRAAYQAQQNRPSTIAQGVEALQNASEALQQDNVQQQEDNAYLPAARIVTQLQNGGSVSNSNLNAVMRTPEFAAVYQQQTGQPLPTGLSNSSMREHIRTTFSAGTAQNAAESLRTNGTAQEGNFTEKAETALGQTRTWQIGAEERIATAQAPRNDGAAQANETGGRNGKEAEIEKAVKIVRDSGIKKGIDITDARLTRDPKSYYEFMKAYWLLQDEGILRRDQNDNIGINYPSAQTEPRATRPKENPAPQPGGNVDVDAIADALNGGKKKVHGYTVFRYRDTTRDGATITVKRPDGTNIKQRIDGGRYHTNRQLNYAAAQMIAEDIGAVDAAQADAANTQNYARELLSTALDTQERWIRGRDRNPSIKRYPAEIVQIALENNITEQEALGAVRDVANGNASGGVYQTVSKMAGGATTDAVADAAQEVRADNAQTEPTAQELKAMLEERIGRPLTMADLDAMSNQELADRIRPAMEQTTGLPLGQGAASAGFDPYSAWQNESDSFHREGEKAARPVELPTENRDGLRTMKGGQTVMEAEQTPTERADQLAGVYVDGGLAYAPVKNAELAASAETKLERDGWEKTLRDWTADVRSGKLNNDIVAMGAVLINQAGNSGMDAKSYLDLASDYVVLTHRAGQALQASRILKNLTPSARLYMMQRSIYSIAEEAGIDDAEINPELAEKYMKAETDKERDAVIGEIQADIASRLKATAMDKWTALRYTNMLGNFKTQVRNLTGNTTMGLEAAIRRRLDAVLGGAAHVLTGGKHQREVSAFYAPSLYSAAWSDFENVKSYAKGESKFSDINSPFQSNDFLRGINDKKRIFKFAPLEGYRKLTQWAMEAGDDIFIRVTYADAMAQYLNAHGVKDGAALRGGEVSEELLDAAREYAAREAQEATFHDTNAFSSWVSQIGRGKNTPKFVKTAVEGTLPFRKTPANVAVRGYEYSPLGVASSLLNTVNAINPNSETTANDAIRSWSKTMTGSALLVAGFTLARMGVLRGKDDDDEKKAAFDHLRGHQEYSIEIGGKSYTIDAFAPSCMPLLVGAEAARLTRDNGWDVKNVESALANLTDPMINMSMLQGVNDTLDNIKFADNSLIQLAELSIFNYLTQGTTNTLAGQLERTFEPNRMTTYTDPDSPLPTWLQKQIGKMSAKTPGWDYQQTEYLDSWGRTQSNGTLGQRAVRNLFAPWYTSELSDDSVENELERLYNDTGNSALLPDAYAPNDMTFDGKQRKATQEEKESYQARAGDAAHNRLEKLFSASEYLKMRDDERAAAIAAIFDYAKAKGKGAAGADYSDPEWLDKSEGSVEKNAAFYGILQAAKQRLDADERDKNAYIMQQIARRKFGDKDTEQVFRQLLGEDSGTLKMAQKFRGEGMSYQDFTRHYANLYDSRQKVDEDDQGKNAPVMMQVLKDTKSDRQAMTEFRMILGDESSTYSKIETLYKEHIPLRQIVGYYNACNEDYAYNPETGKYRKRRKAEKIQWLMDTYGYSQAQAYHMYKVFAG